MKTITTVPVWVNGSVLNATVFNLYVIGGTLGSSASFYYSLLDENLTIVTQGNLSMTGDAYLGWGNNDDYAWEWAAQQLNLVITGDYAPPTTATIEEVITEDVIPVVEEVITEDVPPIIEEAII